MKTNERVIYVRVTLFYFHFRCRFIYGIEIFVFFWTIADLLHCTNEPNVSIPQLANLLIERSQNSNWVVVFKSLVTTHHLMCYGNEVYYIWFSPSFVIHTLNIFLFSSDSDSHSIWPRATAAFNSTIS